MNQKELKEAAWMPTSNDYYIKRIVSKEDADNDDTWYPYIYEVIQCNQCKKDSGYRSKSWFIIFRQVSGVLNNYTCDKCLSKHT